MSKLIDRQTNQAARIVVTCRTASYNTVILSSRQLCEVELRPFDNPEDYVAALDPPAERKTNSYGCCATGRYEAWPGSRCCWRCCVISPLIPKIR